MKNTFKEWANVRNEKTMDKNKKETAQEVPVQEQQLININELRKQYGLKPIYEGNEELIPTE